MTTSTTRGKRRTYEGPSPEEAMANDLIALMESSDTPPWRRPWTGENGPHRNLVTGDTYRGANPILLQLGGLARGTTLPLWCGGAQAKAQGWFPRRGSKCVRIVRPQLHQRDVVDDATGEPKKGTDGQALTTAWVSYRPAVVFNASDLVGHGEAEESALQACIRDAVGTASQIETAARCELAEAALESWPVPTVWGGARACYMPVSDTINMPGREAFRSHEDVLSTWAHEQIHSTGHASRLDRAFGIDRLGPDYAREELVAELGSVLVCYRLGISSDIANHAAYLREWAQLLRESPKVLLKVLSQARQAADLVAPESAVAP